MKKSITTLWMCMGFCAATASAQEVDLSKYTDYTPLAQPDSSLLVYGSAPTVMGKAMPVAQRPDHVNNMESRHFPPVFNQAGGSCGSASRIGYMFTHEMNAYRATDASFMENCYPTHFVWLLTSGNSGKGDFMKEVGIPSATAYGGRTYSELFGNQSEKDEAFGWMNGYDKWYSGMFNRMAKVGSIPANMGTPEGREALKNWLWNHNGDTDYAVGGIGGIGVATGSLTKIPSTPVNDECGLTGLKCVEHWGDQVNHALTIVGYDDRVEFDLNGNGVYGETDADEKGAWIIVNSWGTKWGNGGAVYCPYAYGGKRFNLNEDGSYTFDPRNWWHVEVLKVRKDYRPLRTIKVKMDYNRRSELRLSAGVSSDIESAHPERVQQFHHFNYAGDGNRGNTNPAPLVPMLGRWADGQLHEEPMEFGYDLTDLTAGYDRCEPLKYFFIIETKLWSVGAGHLYNVSLMDYEFDKKGIEFPFDLKGGNVEIKSHGNKTIVTVVVNGEGYRAPRNLSFHDGVLSWETPKDGLHQVEKYNIYRDKTLVGTTQSPSFAITASETAHTYGVTAVYAGNKESAMTNVGVPAIVNTDQNKVARLQGAGLEIPAVFASKFDQATIEFWVSPTSAEKAKFEAGPGFNQFFFTLNEKGAFTVGWDNDKRNKVMTAEKTIVPGKWTHVAMVVNGAKLSLFINGKLIRTVVSQRYHGIGGFGPLILRTMKKVSAIEARFDEFRIWQVARTAAQIGNSYQATFRGPAFPNGLIRYYKGDVVEEQGESRLFDAVGCHHADINAGPCYMEVAEDLTLHAPQTELQVAIDHPATALQAGKPYQMSAHYSDGVSALSWNVAALNIKNLTRTAPTFVFPKAGQYEVTVTATHVDGRLVSDTCIVEVGEQPLADATFTVSNSAIALGERVSFHVSHPVEGYRYEWSMPGADVEHAVATHAAVTYSEVGTHEVTLAVISPEGKKITGTQQVQVDLVAPMADFAISPAVIVKGNTTFLTDRSKYNPSAWQWLISSERKNIIVNGQHSSLTMERPGVYDVMLTATNEKGSHAMTRKSALIVCNAESETGLNFDHTAAQVVFSEVPLAAGTGQFTIDWWMNPDRIATYCNGMGEGESTFLLRNDGDGVLSLFVNGNESKSARKFIIPNQWHHYAVAFDRGQVKFFRDAKMVSSTTNAAAVMPAVQKFAIGSEHACMSGMIDEFRIWGSALSESVLQGYANAPIADVAAAEQQHALKVYYNFNQGSGDVADATSNANTGLRKGFGPDGDAWILSGGVFSLNFDVVEREEVTAQYLKNTKAPFAHEDNVFTNNKEPNRFYAITDWTLENTVTQNGSTSGVYVDGEKDFHFTCQTGWEGFASLVNHKAYQTVLLPPGDYELIANYGDWKSPVRNTVLAVAAGKGLPNAKECGNKALASVTMSAKSPQTMSHGVQFLLKEPTEVSMGLIFNMQGRQSFVLNNFELRRAAFEEVEADGARGYELAVASCGYNTLYLPYAVLVPQGVTAYVAKEIKGTTMVMERITDGVIPAHTGALIAAQTGSYRFAPSTNAGKAHSLLQGVVKATPADSEVRYYVLSENEAPAFRLFEGDVLPANRAFLPASLAESVDKFDLDLVTLGIGAITGEEKDAKWYDISGREVSRPAHGVYISAKRKQFVK